MLLQPNEFALFGQRKGTLYISLSFISMVVIFDCHLYSCLLWAPWKHVILEITILINLLYIYAETKYVMASIINDCNRCEAYWDNCMESAISYWWMSEWIFRLRRKHEFEMLRVVQSSAESGAGTAYYLHAGFSSPVTTYFPMSARTFESSTCRGSNIRREGNRRSRVQCAPSLQNDFRDFSATQSAAHRRIRRREEESAGRRRQRQNAFHLARAQVTWRGAGRLSAAHLGGARRTRSGTTAG